MPDHKKLKVGDRIVLLCVPEADLAQRKRELSNNAEWPGWTADSIERMIRHNPKVTISSVDEYGYAWFDCELKDDSGEIEYHSIMMMDDDSWEYLNEDKAQ